MDDSKASAVMDNLPGKLKLSGAAMGLAAGALAVGVGAALSDGLMNAIELDDAQHKITAQLGLTEEESARIGGVAGSLYSQAYGESVEEVNTAVQNVVSSIDGMRGATAEAVEDMTAKALNFGTAFEVDTARSTQVVGQMLKSGLVADANEGFDLLTAAMQKVPAGVREDILDAADEYGPFFQQMGIDGEEAMNMLVAASEKGMYGIDKTGDAVKEFSIRATDMSKASGAAYEALGLDQEEYTRMLLAGGEQASDAFNTIVLGLQRIEDPAAQSQAALALFGTPLEDLGTSEIPTFLQGLQETAGALGEVSGAADAMGETLNGSASTSWTQLQRTWDSIVGQVGAALLPVLTAVTDWLNENPAVLNIVAAALGVLTLAFIGLTVATWAMNTALLANPITWIILAIVALIAAIVLLVMNWDTVVAWISTVWSGFISWITEVIDGFIGWWNGVWEGFASWIGGVWEGFVSWISSVWSGFVGWLMGIVNGVASWWNGLWAGIGSFFQSAWNGIVQWAVSFIIGFINTWRGVWNGLIGFFSGLWSGIGSAIQSAWSGILSFFGGIPNTILGFFSGIGSWLWNAGRDLINGLLNGIRSLAGTIGNFFLGLLPDWIVGPFKAALGIASPSKVFRGYGQNIVQGLLLGIGDEERGLDARMSGLGATPDLGVGASMAQAILSPPAGAERDTRVSLEGTHVTLRVGEREFDAYMTEQIDGASDDRRTQLVNGNGQVVFA